MEVRNDSEFEMRSTSNENETGDKKETVHGNEEEQETEDIYDIQETVYDN